MYNASDRKQIRAAEKAQQRSEFGKVEFLKSMMSNVHGRLWFYDLLESCHCFNDVPSFDPYKDSYRQGERNVGLRIFADITAHCPDQYISMMKDANARRSELDSAINNDNRNSSDSSDPGQHDRSPYAGWDVEGSGAIDSSVGDI